MDHEKFTKPWIWIFMGHENLIFYTVKTLVNKVYDDTKWCKKNFVIKNSNLLVQRNSFIDSS